MQQSLLCIFVVVVAAACFSVIYTGKTIGEGIMTLEGLPGV